MFVPPFQSFICRVQPGESSPETIVINNTDLNIVYKGDWKYNQKALVSFNRDEHFSANKGDYAEFKFTGSGISVLGTKSDDLGYADIFLDGKKIHTIDGFEDWLKEPSIQTSAHSTKYLNDYLKYVIPEKQVLYSVSGLSKGSHTIKIVVTGKKSTEASDCGVVIDAFELTSH